MTTKKTCQSTTLSDEDREKLAKHSRYQYDIFLLYFPVILSVAVAWCFGYVGFSISWLLPFIVCLYLLWRSKVAFMTDDIINRAYTHAYRKRALRLSESAEWLNFLINRWWIFSSQSAFELFKREIDLHLTQRKPSFLESIEVNKFSLGSQTPFLRNIEAFEQQRSDSQPNDTSSSKTAPNSTRKVASPWSYESSHLNSIKTLAHYQLIVEAEMGLVCDEFLLDILCKWKGFLSANLTIQRLHIFGRIQFIFQFDMNTPFPHINKVTASFIEKPDVWFALDLWKSFDLMHVPLLKSWVHNLFMNTLCVDLVTPGKLQLFTCKESYLEPDNISLNKTAEGVLTVTLQLQPSALSSEAASSTAICTLNYGGQRYVSKEVTQTLKPWQQSFSFFIYDHVQSRDRHKLRIKLKSKNIIGLRPLAVFSIDLNDFPIKLEPLVKAKFKNSEIPLDVQLEYTCLDEINLDDCVYSKPIYSEPEDYRCDSEVSGVIQVRIHSATGLLALDRTGTSDPYCVLFANRKRIKTTHFVMNTCNPKWESVTEFFVADYTQTQLAFFLYDWDGRAVSEDDFLGSAVLKFNESNPVELYRTLPLSFNLTSRGRVSTDNLGTLVVSAVFRPVKSVKKSESIQMKNYLSNDDFVDLQGQASAKISDDRMGFGNLLSQAQGIIEIHIVEARSLIAMDKNGYSDPFCRVKLGNDIIFETKVLKCTLTPKWNERFTTRLPKENEFLEVIVFDKDPVGKDFLGSLKFSVDDLRRLSSKGDAEWFALSRIKSGEICIGCRIIIEELQMRTRLQTRTTSDSDALIELPESPFESETMGDFLDQEDIVEETLVATTPKRSNSMPPHKRTMNSYYSVSAADETTDHLSKSLPSKVPNSLQIPKPQNRSGLSTPLASLNSQLGLSPAVLKRDEARQKCHSDEALDNNHVIELAGYIAAVKCCNLATIKGDIYCKVTLVKQLPEKSLVKSKLSLYRTLSISRDSLKDSVVHFNEEFKVKLKCGWNPDDALLISLKSTHRNQSFAENKLPLKDLEEFNMRDCSEQSDTASTSPTFASMTNQTQSASSNGLATMRWLRISEDSQLLAHFSLRKYSTKREASPKRRGSFKRLRNTFRK